MNEYEGAESTGNGGDHNLDLSLGSSSSKGGGNQALGNHHHHNHHHHEQQVGGESNWRNGGSKTKVG